MNQWIAERQLTLIADDGEARSIVVRIGEPQSSPGRTGFFCELEVLGLGVEKAERIYGLDAFQSLQLALHFISNMLNHYRREAEGRIYWQEPGDDMGFADVDQSSQF